MVGSWVAWAIWFILVAWVSARRRLQPLPRLAISNIIYLMPSISNIKKRGRGRPATGATPVMVRVQPDQLAALDAWIEKQREARSRPEAIRELLERALKLKGK